MIDIFAKEASNFDMAIKNIFAIAIEDIAIKVFAKGCGDVLANEDIAIKILQKEEC